MTAPVIIYSDLHTNRIEPEMRVQRAVAAIGIGDVHRLANHDECGTVGLTWLDQSHGLDQFAVMSVQHVQHAVSAEYVEQLAHFAVFHIDQPNAIVGEALTVEVGVLTASQSSRGAFTKVVAFC